MEIEHVPNRMDTSFWKGAASIHIPRKYPSWCPCIFALYGDSVDRKKQALPFLGTHTKTPQKARQFNPKRQNVSLSTWFFRIFWLCPGPSTTLGGFNGRENSMGRIKGNVTSCGEVLPFTLPETNIAPLRKPSQKEAGSSSNHPLSGANC